MYSLVIVDCLQDKVNVSKRNDVNLDIVFFVIFVSFKLVQIIINFEFLNLSNFTTFILCEIFISPYRIEFWNLIM